MLVAVVDIMTVIVTVVIDMMDVDPALHIDMTVAAVLVSIDHAAITIVTTIVMWCELYLVMLYGIAAIILHSMAMFQDNGYVCNRAFMVVSRVRHCNIVSHPYS